MKDNERDALVVDVADALTLHQEVQWDRCEKRATPANRRLLDNLRALSGVFAGGPPGDVEARPGGPVSAAGPLAGAPARLAVRVPRVREAVRGASRGLLRYSRFGRWLAAAPLLALAWLVASRPEREVGAVLGDPLLRSLAAAAGLLVLVAAARKRMLSRLDAWIPDVADQPQLVADAAAALSQAGRATVVGRIVGRTALRGCGAPATLRLAAGDGVEAADLAAPDGRTAPLSQTSAIVHMLEAAGGSLRVHPDDESSFFALLPPADAAWVVETGADAVVAVPGPGAELLGVLVAGRRVDGRIVRAVDVPFLEALGAAAGLAAARLRAMRVPGAGPLEGPPAHECPRCRRLTGPGEPPVCDCGPAYVQAEVPRLLAGKYRLSRRLGRGGMGAVYLARDLQLERDVAVKTLTGVTVPRLMGVKPEARAMATAAHPAVAQVYGVESWRGRPFLIVEHLAGGTLADRLRGGPLPAPRAVSVAEALAGALAALHETGYLHGDVKPGNVGLAADGSPKLLDFGLAHGTRGAPAGAGTLRYLSPEALAGRTVAEADDVWSLCVVLYEMASGEHPFAPGAPAEVAERIVGRRLRRPAPTPADPAAAAVVAFAASVLAAPRASRPATARAFAEAVRAVLPDPRPTVPPGPA